MKKEVIFVITAGLFILASVLDYFAGNLQFRVNSPILFLSAKYFSLYPMTFVAVVMRSVALVMAVSLLFSAIDRQYFKKLAISLFVTFIAEIYAFQQLATGARITPMLWTLAISYAGVGLLVPMVYYIFAGIADFLIPHNKNEVRLPRPEPDSNDSGSNSSILTPEK